MFGLPEKVGFVGGKEIERQLRFAAAIVHDELEVVVITIQLIVAESLRQAAGYQRLLGRRQLYPRRLMKPALETGELIIMQLGLIQKLSLYLCCRRWERQRLSRD